MAINHLTRMIQREGAGVYILNIGLIGVADIVTGSLGPPFNA